MVGMFFVWVGLQALSGWWTIHQDDAMYGRPRTAQYDEIVGHHDSPSNPSHFIALNLHGTAVVFELPGGDASKAKIYKGPQIIAPHAALVPVTLTFSDVTHDGKLDMLMQLHHDWDAFFKARDAYALDPSKFLGRPRLPKYKHKTEGRNLLVYTIQAISKRGLKHGLVELSMLPMEIKTQHTEINQVRIVPRNGFYVIEVVYEHEQPKSAVNPALYAGIDIGMDNLAMCQFLLTGVQ